LNKYRRLEVTGGGTTSDVLHLEGEAIQLIPPKTKPQGIAKVKRTTISQHGWPVYTFTPIGVVPRPSG
jgi:hypothetical protein